MKIDRRSWRAVAPAAMLCLATFTAGCGPEQRAVTPEALAGMIEQGKAGATFHLVDLRDEHAFATLRVPGAINVPYERLAADRTLFIDGRPVIFYDDHAPDVKALRKHLGARLPANVVVLDGGFRGWLAARLPVEKGKS
jgi:rhodanese-related sulfurtransferase